MLDDLKASLSSHDVLSLKSAIATSSLFQSKWGRCFFPTVDHWCLEGRFGFISEQRGTLYSCFVFLIVEIVSVECGWAVFVSTQAERAGNEGVRDRRGGEGGGESLLV